MSRLLWNRAEALWSPDGYELRVPAFVYQREVAILRRTQRVRLDDLSLDVEIVSGRLTQTTETASAEPGEIRLSAPDLLSRDGVEIRNAIDAWVDEAVETAERDEAEDKTLAERFLAEVRLDHLDPGTGLPEVRAAAAD